MRAPEADMSAMAPRSRRPWTSISTGIRERQRGAASRSMNLIAFAAGGGSGIAACLRRLGFFAALAFFDVFRAAFRPALVFGVRRVAFRGLRALPFAFFLVDIPSSGRHGSAPA